MAITVHPLVGWVTSNHFSFGYNCASMPIFCHWAFPRKIYKAEIPNKANDRKKLGGYNCASMDPFIFLPVSPSKETYIREQPSRNIYKGAALPEPYIRADILKFPEGTIVLQWTFYHLLPFVLSRAGPGWSVDDLRTSSPSFDMSNNYFILSQLGRVQMCPNELKSLKWSSVPVIGGTVNLRKIA